MECGQASGGNVSDFYQDAATCTEVSTFHRVQKTIGETILIRFVSIKCYQRLSKVDKTLLPFPLVQCWLNKLARRAHPRHFRFSLEQHCVGEGRGGGGGGKKRSNILRLHVFGACNNIQVLRDRPEGRRLPVVVVVFAVSVPVVLLFGLSWT